MASAVFNCVKENERSLVDEKALLISLSLGIPIDDFYEVDGRLTYRGPASGYVADCEEYLSLVNKYDEEAILEASLYMFNLIRRGVRGKLGGRASELLSELGLLRANP
ncbi:MAG: hypothetical protein ACP5HQ_03210 [Thermoprotei archaeon]